MITKSIPWETRIFCTYACWSKAVWTPAPEWAELSLGMAEHLLRGTRTTFLRQAANLWRVKQEIRRILLTRLLPNGSQISIVDGFPMPVCGFRRAHFSKLFKGEATYGYCAAKAMTYYGLKGASADRFERNYC